MGKENDLLKSQPECIEDMLLGWLCMPDAPTPESEREKDVQMFGDLLRLAESTRFSGAVTLTFGEGYLRSMREGDRHS